MLIFFDETFRTLPQAPVKHFGALCGIGVPENELGRVAGDVYQLKVKHMDAEFAKNGEIKGKELLKNYVFKLRARGIESEL